MLQCPICKERESENFKVFRDVLDQLIELYPPLAQAEPTWLQLQEPPKTTREAFSWEFGYEENGGAGYQWPKGQYPRFDYGEDGAIINVWVPEASVWCDPYEDFTKAQASQNRIWQSWCLWGKDLVAYRILDSRGKEAAASVLAGFKGVVMADAYTVYQSLAKETGLFVVALCWAHVRRRFVECQENFPAESGEALTMFKALYAVEREGKAEGADLAALRDRKSRPIVDAIFIWARDLARRELPRAGLGEALSYLLNHEEGLRRFLDDPHIPIDNNGTEAAQRGIVLGRKNHYGSRSRRGTEVAAIYYTLVECAKLAGVSPRDYIIAVARAARESPGAVLLPADFKAMLTVAQSAESKGKVDPAAV